MVDQEELTHNIWTVEDENKNKEFALGVITSCGTISVMDELSEEWRMEMLDVRGLLRVENA